MLLKRLLERLDAKTYRTVLIPWAGQKTGQILREICDKIRLDVAGRTPLIQRLHKAMARSNDAPYTVVAIDEAHNLPREALHELFSHRRPPERNRLRVHRPGWTSGADQDPRTGHQCRRQIQDRHALSDHAPG
ncbi:MAG: ATP-binding protein [Fibrobacteres bacterium]|nr:ATP-binding protein [Fibrobacterota bacterium]